MSFNIDCLAQGVGQEFRSDVSDEAGRTYEFQLRGGRQKFMRLPSEGDAGIPAPDDAGSGIKSMLMGR
jgi:hypothetical protein